MIIIGVVLIIMIKRKVGIDHYLQHHWKIVTNHHGRKVIIMLKMIKGG